MPHAPQSPTTPADQDIILLANALTEKRFHFVDRSSPCAQTLFSMAAEEQTRKFLSKAENPARHRESEERAFDLQKPTPISKEKLLAAGMKIGTLPTVFYNLMDTINNPYSSAADVAAIIATDPALSAKLLRLINSPFYGLRNPVDNVQRAVAIIGSGPLVMLTMGTTLITAFNGIPTTIMDMRSFWMHSTSTGVIAKTLASRLHLPDADHFFVAGLLHDIARLLIFLEAPTTALYLLTESRQKAIPMHDLEKEILGFNHAELAAELLVSWRCPESLIAPISIHHNPLPKNATPADAILPMANALSAALGYGSSGSFFIPSIDDVTWELLAITPELLPSLTKSMEDTIRDMVASLLKSDKT